MMAEEATRPPPPLAHAASLQPLLRRPPSPVFRAPLDLVVTAGGSDIPLDINLAIKGIHAPSLQYRIQQQQQALHRDKHRRYHHHHRDTVPNVTVERVPAPPPPPQLSRRPLPRSPLMVSSLSAASASHSQFGAATNANQVPLRHYRLKNGNVAKCYIKS